jgi:antitoxin ParD1/3/4
MQKDKYMAQAEKISITLPPDMLASIKEKVQDGLYASTSEVIRDAMRLWQKQDEEHQARLALLRQRLENSANSGAPVPLTEAFQRIEKRHKNHMSSVTNENI